MHPRGGALRRLRVLPLPRHDAEQFAWAWFQSEILYSKRLVFKSQNLYWDILTQGNKNK